MAYDFKYDPHYERTMELAKQGAKKHGAFGRFQGRKDTDYTLNELVIKHWFDRHGIAYQHNLRIPDGEGGSVEYDFYLPAFAQPIEVNPLFHYKTGHPVTRRVMLNDWEKIKFAKAHGMGTMIEIIVYDDPEWFAREIAEKLGPFARR